MAKQVSKDYEAYKERMRLMIQQRIQPVQPQLSLKDKLMSVAKRTK